MKNAHTPSPWQFRKSESGIYITTVGAIFRRQKGEDIPSTEQRANALLISKAPEMLEMLKECASVLRWTLDNAKPDSDWTTFTNSITNAMVASEELIKSATQIK